MWLGWEAMSVRVDVWLWSVRIFKTRSAANSACQRQNVRVNGKIVKPSKIVIAGDSVAAKTAQRLRTLEVVKTPKKRVGAAVAAESYIDHSPPPEPKATRLAPPAVRDRGAGRPTKRDRRKIDELKGR